MEKEIRWADALCDEFRALAVATSISTPAMDVLYEYIDPSAEPIAEGSAELPLDWREVWKLGLALLVLAVLISMI